MILGKNISIFSMILFIGLFSSQTVKAEYFPKYLITNESSFKVNNETWEEAPGPGDTIYVSSTRTEALSFEDLVGAKDNPITVININGQVKIESEGRYAIKFVDCKHIKISGTGDSDIQYGFQLGSIATGLEFGQLSSDCEAEFIKIDHEGFFGIVAKKDYHGTPPSPAPVFDGLRIHDCFIKNVTEGMYLGETVSPGMEFKHVEIYNNIVSNTGREAIQIANMVEDVKIYNNTLVSGGNDGESYQGNLLQIGDNSVAEVFNNIIIGANQYGITCFGNGENKFYNNYISNCKGIFIDNRIFSNPESTIELHENYFHNITGSEVIKNYNEVNALDVQYNVYDNNIQFLNNTSEAPESTIVQKNTLTQIPELTFIDVRNNNFNMIEESEEAYSAIGARQNSATPNNFIKSTPQEATSEIADFYPNPVIDNELNIRLLQEYLGEINITIFDLSGRKLLESKFDSSYITTKIINLSPVQKEGMLIVKIESEFGNRQVSKVLKKEY